MNSTSVGRTSPAKNTLSKVKETCIGMNYIIEDKAVHECSVAYYFVTDVGVSVGKDSYTNFFIEVYDTNEYAIYTTGYGAPKTATDSFDEADVIALLVACMASEVQVNG